MNTRPFLNLLLLAVAIPLAFVSCKDDASADAKAGAEAKSAADAKYHYAVAMTGVV